MQRIVIGRMAIASSPSAPVTTTGRLTIASRSRIATCGWLMIGVAAIAPNWPGLVIVNVPPRTSSGRRSPSRARPARSRTRRARPSSREVLRVADHGHDQPVVAERDGDPEVHAVVLGEAVALEPGVERRELAQRVDDAARDDRQRRRADQRARGARRALMSHSTIVVQCAAVSSERFMCSPIVRRMRESGSPRGAPATGAGPARARTAAAWARAGRATRCAAAARGARASAAPAPPSTVGEHVLLAHAPAAPGARDAVEVDAVLGGDARHDRAVAPWAGMHAGADAPVTAGGGSGACSGAAGSRRGAGASASLACASPGRASVAIRASTVPTSTVCAGARRRSRASAAGRRRGDLGVDLVGRDVADRLLVLDPVAGAACARRRSCPRRPTRPSGA